MVTVFEPLELLPIRGGGYFPIWASGLAMYLLWLIECNRRDGASCRLLFSLFSLAFAINKPGWPCWRDVTETWRRTKAVLNHTRESLQPVPNLEGIHPTSGEPLSRGLQMHDWTQLRPEEAPIGSRAIINVCWTSLMVQFIISQFHTWDVSLKNVLF